jgi:hypothetical protein
VVRLLEEAYYVLEGEVEAMAEDEVFTPANHSYRFNRDWDYLAERLG